MDAPMRVNWKSTVNDRFRRIAVNGKVVSLDDVVFGYERVFQSLELFSSVSWLGVSMQQTPNDAFVIAGKRPHLGTLCNGWRMALGRA